MCIPMLAPIGMALGASAGSAATIGTLVTAGAGMSALGAYQGAQSQKAMANYNAQVAQNNAQVAEWQAQDAQRRGEEEAQAVRRQGDQIRGSQRATMAARGLDLAEGTSAELIAQTDFFSLADQTTARNNAAREAWGVGCKARTSGPRPVCNGQRLAASNPGWPLHPPC